MDVIGSATNERGDLSAKTATIAVAGMLVFCLSACVSSGVDVLSAVNIDRTATTGSIPESPSTSDSVSDEMAVRDAVSSADLTNADGRPLPWVNVSTGSAGIIETIVENTKSGVRCRQFRLIRHAYDGVSHYDGRTCLVDDGNWQLLSFRPAG